MTSYFIPPVADPDTIWGKARKEARETGQVITVHAHAKGQRCNPECEAIYEPCLDGSEDGPHEPTRRSCRRCS